jgi:hypothetical protein
MKRSILMTAIALMISAGITAQVTTQTRQQSQAQTATQAQAQAQTHEPEQMLDRVRDQERLKDGIGPQAKLTKEQKKMMKAQKKELKKANHGQVVSETERAAQSGPGKGEIVSTQARNKGQIQQARIKENNSAKNQSANKGARGNAVQSRAWVPVRSGAGRK